MDVVPFVSTRTISKISCVVTDLNISLQPNEVETLYHSSPRNITYQFSMVSNLLSVISVKPWKIGTSYYVCTIRF